MTTTEKEELLIWQLITKMNRIEISYKLKIPERKYQGNINGALRGKLQKLKLRCLRSSTMATTIIKVCPQASYKHHLA